MIFCPMDQLGCFKASALVFPSISSFFSPKKGPPDAVNKRDSTDLSSSPRRHCQMAECSESMGKSLARYSKSIGIIKCPAQTNVSLLANAIFFPALIAEIVGRIPIIPTKAITTISASGSVASSIKPSIPEDTGISKSVESFSAKASSYTQSLGTCHSLACSFKSSILDFTESPMTLCSG